MNPAVWTALLAVASGWPAYRYLQRARRADGSPAMTDGQRSALTSIVWIVVIVQTAAYYAGTKTHEAGFTIGIMGLVAEAVAVLVMCSIVGEHHREVQKAEQNDGRRRRPRRRRHRRGTDQTREV